MKYLLFISLLFAFSIQTLAQHCPFDGGSLVVVHLTDEQGKIISPDSVNLTLVEVDNPQADSCTYAEGLLKKPFLPNKENLQTRFKDFWDYWIEPHTKDWILLNAGYYSTSLNMSETSCMIRKDRDFSYKKRKFEIHYQDNGVNKTIKVDEKSIYPLCTNAGKWTRIIPIEIEITKKYLAH